MKVMRQNIDEDFSHNYIAMWHDESHWNKYLIDNPPEKVLDPGYCYPETMVEEFYKKVWRQDYHKRLVALHKGFLATAKGGEEIRKTVDLL
jgi:histo-blood group ABO system transferase